MIFSLVDFHLFDLYSLTHLFIYLPISFIYSFILLYFLLGRKKWKWGVSAYFNYANQFYERLTHTIDKFTSYLRLTYCFFRSLMLHYHQRCVFYIAFLNDVTFFQLWWNKSWFVTCKHHLDTLLDSYMRPIQEVPIGGHSFSTYTKLSAKLTFITKKC